MAAPAVNRFIDINGSRFVAVPNLQRNDDGTAKTKLDLLNDFQGTGTGIYRGLKLLEGNVKLAVLYLKDVGSVHTEFWQDLAGKLGTAANALSVFRLQDVTSKAYKAVTDWTKPAQVVTSETYRAQYQRLHDIGEGVATWGFVASFFTNNSFYANIAGGPDTLANVTDLTMSAQDWRIAGEALEHVNRHDPENAPVQQMFMDKMRHALLLTLKAACSVFSGVIGLMVLAFGGPILPPLPLIALGLTGTVSAIAAHFFKETAAYKLPKFPEIARA